MDRTPEQHVRELPLWRGPIAVAVLKGGVSNASFTVRDETGTYVARVGHDYPAHHVFRNRELMVSRAAFAAGLSPEVVHAEPGVMIIRHIEAVTYTEALARANASRCVEIIKRCHRTMPKRMFGPPAFFWVFQILRDYAHTLEQASHRRASEIPRWLALTDKLEAAQLPMPIVVGHHDLLPANFLDDGKRLWLIDWEYAAFGTPMFDLANLASNSAFGRLEEQVMLESYFERPPSAALWRCFDAMKTASALREAVWGMISELFLAAPGVDYVAYAEEYLSRFETVLAAYEFKYGKL